MKSDLQIRGLQRPLDHLEGELHGHLPHRSPCHQDERARPARGLPQARVLHPEGLDESQAVQL